MSIPKDKKDINPEICSHLGKSNLGRKIFPVAIRITEHQESEELTVLNGTVIEQNGCSLFHFLRM